MAFQLTPLHIPSLTTDFSAQTNATARLGQMLGDLPGEMRKEHLAQQKQQILGQIGTGNLDYEKAGRSLIALGDTQAGATLLGLGQKQQERDLEKTWMGGGSNAAPVALGSTAGVGPASLIQNESGGNWGASNNAVGAGGQVGHDGRAQFGRARLQEAANAGAIPQGVSREEFRKSPQLQKQAESWHFGNIDDFIQANGYDKMIGQSINGVPITVDGMRAVAHLGGNGGLRKFIETGGKYNPSDANGTSLMDYFTRHGGNSTPLAPRTQIANPVAQPQQPVQIAENEADVQRLEQQQAAAQPVSGDNPAKLRADAQYYAQSNPEAARQLNARADTLERSARADLPPQGANATPTQGFAIPGEQAQQSILNDKNVQLWTQRHATAPTERTRAIAKQQLDLAVKDAEQRYAEGKTPEAVREFIWAKRNGLTDAKSPIAYAKEKADATRADTAPVTRQIKQADGSEVVVQWNPDARRWDPLTAPEGGEAVRPKGQKLTEGQSKDLVFHNRGIQALEAFEPVADAYAVGVDRVAAQVPGGNYIVPENFQKAQQAGRNFLASILRKDSGAAITAPEEAQYGAIFLPQPGDKPGTLAQKAEARKQAIDAIRNGLGTAEVLALGQRLTTRNPGEAPPPPATPAPAPPQAAPPQPPVQRPAGNGPVTITNPNTGQRLMLTPDGKWAPFDG